MRSCGTNAENPFSQHALCGWKYRLGRAREGALLRAAVFAAGILLAAGLDAEAQQETKSISIFAMDDATGIVREIATIPGFPIINSPEISPDGKWVAVDGWRSNENLRDARILVVNIENGAVLDLGKGAMPTWSADGRWIAFSKYSPVRGVYVRSFEGNEESLIDGNGWGIQWAPSGMKAVYSRRGRLVIYDFVSGTKEEVRSDGEWPYQTIYWNCKWSPDSQRICFRGLRSDGKHEFAIVNVAQSEARLENRWDAKDFNPDIAWHPSGSPVAIPRKAKPGMHGQIYIFDPDSVDPPMRLAPQPPDRNNGGMCWSRDGETFIFVSRE